jgi:hypothetical protein
VWQERHNGVVAGALLFRDRVENTADRALANLAERVEDYELEFAEACDVRAALSGHGFHRRP